MLGSVGVDVLNVDIVDQRASRWLTFYLEHSCGGEEFISSDHRCLIIVLKTVWHVSEVKSLEVGKSVVQWDGKSSEDELVIDGSLILVLKFK